MKKKNRFPKKIIVITGPTASGKTELSLKIASWLQTKRVKRFLGVDGAEIISADSRQVYKMMDIGTAKIKKEEMRGIPHHLLSVASPKRFFSAAQFRKMALKKMEEIFQRKKIPIVCGGSWFYIKALIKGMVFPEVPPDWKLRRKLEKFSPQKLYQRLKKMDPQRAQNIEKENPRRLIRAIEIAKKLKSVPPLFFSPLPYPVLILAPQISWKKLKKIIAKRFIRWLREGLVEEIKNLRKMGISWKKIESFGMHYKIISQYLQKKLTKEEMIKKSIKEIENYAKKQMGWLKKEKDIVWVKKEWRKKVKNFLEKGVCS